MRWPFLVLLSALGQTLAATSSLKGLYALVERRIPVHAKAFTFHLVNGTGDSFVISDIKQDKFNIECTTVIACARGLYTYVFGCHACINL